MAALLLLCRGTDAVDTANTHQDGVEQMDTEADAAVPEVMVPLPTPWWHDADEDSADEDEEEEEEEGGEAAGHHKKPGGQLNPELLMLFDSHINVDYVTSPIAARYIYKVQFMLLYCRASLTSNVSVRH